MGGQLWLGIGCPTSGAHTYPIFLLISSNSAVFFSASPSASFARALVVLCSARVFDRATPR